MHTCNYYCRDGQHCDLYHASPNVTTDGIWQALGYYLGLKVEHAEPAREPPPKSGNEPIVVGSDPGKATMPWLVWWQA